MLISMFSSRRPKYCTSAAEINGGVDVRSRLDDVITVEMLTRNIHHHGYFTTKGTKGGEEKGFFNLNPEPSLHPHCPAYGSQIANSSSQTARGRWYCSGLEGRVTIVGTRQLSGVLNQNAVSRLTYVL